MIRVQILGEGVRFSLSANTLEKGMHPTLLSPGQSGLFNLGKTTYQEEKSPNSNLFYSA